MNREEILNTLEVLSRTQGMYGRLLHQIGSLSPVEREHVMEELEAQDFQDAVDMIMFFEC